MDFSGKTAFVTGAANGIGLGICRALARGGVTRARRYRESRLEFARQELSDFNVRTRAIEVDVSDAAAYERAADQAEAEFVISISCSTMPASLWGRTRYGR